MRYSQMQIASSGRSSEVSWLKGNSNDDFYNQLPISMNVALATSKYTCHIVLILSLLCLVSTSEVAAQDSGISQDLPKMAVHKRPDCNCCSRWVDHLKENGFEVSASDAPDLATIKDDASIPDSLRSCHTAFVGDYTIEGHVPAEVIKRMLQEQPDITGLTVPGMPIGSPGMEMPGREAESYEVIAFTKDGSTHVYARR